MKISAPEGPVKPGEKGSINVQISARYFRDDISKEIEVLTNDPKNEKILLQVKGKIKKYKF